MQLDCSCLGNLNSWCWISVLLLLSYPCRKGLFCFVWPCALLLEELRAFHCCPWLVACSTPMSFSRNDDPRSLEFDCRKWQGNDGTGYDHRISALLVQAGMGDNSRGASGSPRAPLLAPRLALPQLLHVVEQGRWRNRYLLGLLQARCSTDHRTCPACEALSSSRNRQGNRSSQRFNDLPKTTQFSFKLTSVYF